MITSWQRWNMVSTAFSSIVSQRNLQIRKNQDSSCKLKNRFLQKLHIYSCVFCIGTRRLRTIILNERQWRHVIIFLDHTWSVIQIKQSLNRSCFFMCVIPQIPVHSSILTHAIWLSTLLFTAYFSGKLAIKYEFISKVNIK